MIMPNLSNVGGDRRPRKLPMLGLPFSSFSGSNLLPFRPDQHDGDNRPERGATGVGRPKGRESRSRSASGRMVLMVFVS